MDVSRVTLESTSPLSLSNSTSTVSTDTRPPGYPPDAAMRTGTNSRPLPAPTETGFDSNQETLSGFPESNTRTLSWARPEGRRYFTVAYPL